MSPGLFVYREHLGSIGANFRVDLDNRINVTVSPLLARSKHVVYTNIVEALLRFVLVNKGYMLLHSATVSWARDDHAVGADRHWQDRHDIEADAGTPGQLSFLVRRHDDHQREGEALFSEAADHQLAHAACGEHQSAVSSRRVLGPEPSPLEGWAPVRASAGQLNIPIIAINALTQILVPPPKYMIDRLVPTAEYSRPAGSARSSSSAGVTSSRSR